MSKIGFFKSPKNITGLFTFDLTSFFFEEDYTELSSDEKEGVFMIEYEKILPHIELGLFNKVIFRVFNDKKNIRGSNHINVSFPAEPGNTKLPAIKKLIYKLVEICGGDDENRADWTINDESDFNNGYLDRQWTLGEGKNIYSVRLTMNSKDGLVLKILFFNHLLELINK
ncbi:MAG: hypothetical protein WCX31_11740 [Salinivirgaceae bacterium]|jgi:hypothetical protein